MLPHPHEPLPPPVKRAINREPVIEEEWPYDDERSFKMIPVPGGCIVVGTPRPPLIRLLRCKPLAAGRY
ncbi:MAG: hypothetical protein ACXV3F_10080 [Frankiaceae bacterium]